MTISTTTNRVTYTGNGATVAFSFPYAFFAQADLVVIETIIATGVQTTKTLTTHYTISGTTDSLGHYPSGGTVTAVAAPASTVTWTIYRDPTATQTTDLVENDPMPAESIEAALDYQTVLNQRTRDIAARSLQQPEGDSATIDRLPAKVDRASKYLAFDAEGDPVATAGTTSSYVVTPFMETVLDDANAAAARATLGLDVAAKGDLFAATANDTVATLSVGTTTGHTLLVDPSASTGLSYGPRSQPNPIINGNMEIWQRGTTFVSPIAAYVADRWRVRQVSSGTVTVNRSTDVPTVAQAGVAFNYSCEIDVTLADAVDNAGDHLALIQRIEGYDWRHFAQRAFVLSFWARSSKTGVHSVGFRNGSTADRSYIGTYTVASANTWAYHTLTVPASPSAGTWNYTSGTGLEIMFNFMGAITNSTIAGSWQTGDFYSSSVQVNGMDSAANVFRLTGVKLELGSVATPIQFAPFGEELARCQRYYQKSFPYATAPAQNIGANFTEYKFPAITGGATSQRSPFFAFPVPMRIAPTMTGYNPAAANAQVRDTTGSLDCASTSLTQLFSERGFAVSCVGNAGTSAANYLGLNWTADAEL